MVMRFSLFPLFPSLFPKGIIPIIPTGIMKKSRKIADFAMYVFQGIMGTMGIMDLKNTCE